MAFFIGLLIMVVFAGLMVVGLLYVIAKFFTQITLQPGSKAWERAVKDMRQRLGEFRGKLVPWDGEMLPLLSLNRQDVQKPGFFGGPYRGVFTTIYHEPALAYAYQASGSNFLMLLQSQHNEWVLRRNKGEVEIWSNGQPLGVYKDGVLLGPGRNPRILARLEREGYDSQFPLTIGDRAAATLTNPEHIQSPNPRVLLPLRNLDGQEEKIAIAVAGIEMARIIPAGNK